MIYAIRQRGPRQTLVEMTSQGWADVPRVNHDFYYLYRRVDARTARQWVRDGKEHETGLFIEDGKVRYALPEMREA